MPSATPPPPDSLLTVTDESLGLARVPRLARWAPHSTSNQAVHVAPQNCGPRAPTSRPSPPSLSPRGPCPPVCMRAPVAGRCGSAVLSAVSARVDVELVVLAGHFVHARYAIGPHRCRLPWDLLLWASCMLCCMSRTPETGQCTDSASVSTLPLDSELRFVLLCSLPTCIERRRATESAIVHPRKLCPSRTTCTCHHLP